jgi:hypothetical protein
MNNNVAEQNVGHGIEFEGPNSDSHVLGNTTDGNFSGLYITAEPTRRSSITM